MTDKSPITPFSTDNRTVTIVLPEGYKSGSEFCDDCGFEFVCESRIISFEDALTVKLAQEIACPTKQ